MLFAILDHRHGSHFRPPEELKPPPHPEIPDRHQRRRSFAFRPDRRQTSRRDRRRSGTCRSADRALRSHDCCHRHHQRLRTHNGQHRALSTYPAARLSAHACELATMIVPLDPCLELALHTGGWTKPLRGRMPLLRNAVLVVDRMNPPQSAALRADHLP
jgi:hypothetical protein